MWAFCFSVTLFSVIVSQCVLYFLFLLFGDAAFGKSNAFYIGAVVPVLVAFPVTYLMSRMAVQLSSVHTQLRRLADTDELTGLTNRRSFFSQATEVLQSSREDLKTLSLLVIDADYFKQLNDTYGHATGDAALQFITEKLLDCVRKTDLVCRLGGEEFAILLPDMAEAQAGRLAKRLLKEISGTPMVHDSRIIEMSVSCGVADTTQLGYDITRLFKAADDALYAAKDAGRNRTITYSDYALATTSTSHHGKAASA
ncbi:MAG: GGDEF domain-containing protein [Pseudomonadales bacterium]|nr:GGDEF domain-containing protein [Pseudomonadales bacterium]